ncbi:MAG: PEP-CTERM sorting domain-containing protein [Roseateles sp.]|nr:MAG: PEP-CTERM sorting domain-containing protein [Roseateles sp.]
MNKLFAITALLAAASAPALADTLPITFLGVDDNAPLLSTTYTSDYGTGVQSYQTASGSSFLAYCIEPDQSTLLVGKTRPYTVEALSGSQASLLQGLYSSSFASANDLNSQAAFQLAIWEIVRETTGTLNVSPNAGSFSLLPGDAASRDLDAGIASLANNYLAAAQAYNGPAQYTLTKLSNTSYQDLLVANPVPEPQTWALLLAGLGAVGLLARRRQR